MLDVQELDRVIALPGFPAYMRRGANIWRAPLTDDPILSSTLRDLGRFVSGVWSLFLHATPGGITLARLSDLMEETGVSGPGRARSMVIFLRFIGYIEPVRDGGDGRVRAFRPTLRMSAAFRERYRRELVAAGPMDPVLAAGLARLDDDDFFNAMMAAMGELSLAGFQGFERRDASLEAISHRFAGMMVLGEVLGAGEASDGPFPPIGPFAISLAAIAKACGISRTQVRRILRAGASEGFLELTGDGEIMLTPLLTSHIELLLACTLIMLRWSCSQALAATGAPEV